MWEFTTISVCFTWFMLLVTCSAGKGPVVRTTLGSVQGTRAPVLRTAVDIFYGIPYAAPPVGDLRFKRPLEPEAWNGTRGAQVMPNSCYQIIDTMFDRFEGVEMWNPNTNLSEDCLYLNVWSPVQGSEKKAILIWIFGGTFALGTSTLRVYDGKYLAANNDVIVVTLNYRIGPFGFLYSGEEAPGNVGLLDQVMALKWVKDNAVFFRGDPDRITIFGESAGAVSVSLLLFSPLSRDLFNNAIMQSASAMSYWGFYTVDKAMKRTEKLADIFDCPSNYPKDMAQCLRDIPAANLSQEAWSIVDYYFDAPFAPIVDHYFLWNTPAELLANKSVKNASILLGVNQDEGNYFLLYGITDKFVLDNKLPLTRSEYLEVVGAIVAPGNERVQMAIASLYEQELVASNRASYRQIADDISGDRAFKCPTIDFARDMANINENVYLYSFEHRVSTNPWPKWTGVMHGYEIEVVFGLPLEAGNGYRADEVEFSKELMKMWTNFAKTGNPNDRGQDVWPTYNIHSEHYLRLNSSYTAKVDSGLRHTQCMFWREIVPLLDREDDPATVYPLPQCINDSRPVQPSWNLILLSTIVFMVIHRKYSCA